MANDSTVKAGSLGARGRSRRSSASRRRRAPDACRCSTSSTRPARASPTRSRCSPAGAARGASSTTRSQLSGVGAAGLPAVRARARPAAPTSPRSATSWSWSRATPSMYLGSPRMAEMVIGEKVTPRGDGRRADALPASGCGDVARARPRRRRIARGPALLLLLPASCARAAAGRGAAGRRRVDPARIGEHRSPPTRTSRST